MNKINGNIKSNKIGETKIYEKPTLVAYGDVRDVTLGGTGGLGESGCECLFRELPSGASGACPVVCPR